MRPMDPTDIWWSIVVLLLPYFSSAVELTFELQDRDTQCFFEDMKKGEQSTLEFQVRRDDFHLDMSRRGCIQSGGKHCYNQANEH